MKESVTIFGKEKCPHTRAAIDAHKAKGDEVLYQDVLLSEDAMNKMLALSDGERKVPVILKGRTVTIGWEGRS
ncbi:MAG: glutaredoxin [Desulfobacterales bacterium]|nr:glutaredoxin [Desulfobacterales bacterium]